MKTTPRTPLSSKDNPFMKSFRSLADPKYRRKEQAFVIEGVKMVEEALRDNAGVVTVVAEPSLTQHHGKGVLKLAESKSVEVVWISERLMDSMAESKTPQPVMAMVRMKKNNEEEILSNPSKLIVVANHLQDPGNLGTIIRTAEAVAASGVAVTANTVDPYNAKAVRASMGSILRVPVVAVKELSAFLEKCGKNGFQTAATVVTGDKAHFDVDLTKPTVLVFGQEGAGLPEEIMTHIDLQIRIPMAQTIDSLNVATSAAVVLYEAVRQRKKK